MIISVQPKEAGVTGAESREAAVARQAKEMLEKVPRAYDMFEVKERFAKRAFAHQCAAFHTGRLIGECYNVCYRRLHAMGHAAPMNIFLKHEIDRMQVVIKLVRVSLRDLLLAIEGVIVMSEVISESGITCDY